VRRRLSLILLLAVTGCAGVGSEPLAGKPLHHVEGGFRNLDPEFRRPGFVTRWVFLVRHGLGHLLSPRAFLAPRRAPDVVALRDGRLNPSVTWIGHATLLVQIGGLNVLTDPHWGERASPLAWAGPRRLSPPGIPFEALPRVDVVVLSHDHYDHLDAQTVGRLAREHDPLFLAPLGFKAWFADIGIGRVEELDWWEERVVAGVRFVCLPTQHWTQRAPWDLNRRLWASWGLIGAEGRVYFSGDTGYFPGFREVGQRLGPFDVAAMAIGAYRPAEVMRLVHLTPEQAVQAAEDLRARILLGVHWGTFDLAEEPLDEPPRRMSAEARKRGIADERVWVLGIGETRRW
jgi:L-ascorbate metabolism protein UlaG (beta-lactamase superfamily)